MDKKGFTLIELLGSIVILSILVLITSKAITGILKSGKVDIYESQIKLIESASKLYVDSNDIVLPNATSSNPTIIRYILLSDLKESDLLDEEIINPKNNKEFTDDDLIIKITISYDDKYKRSNVNYEVITDKEEITNIKNNYVHILYKETFSTLINGQSFNSKIKTLANGSSKLYSDSDTVITNITFLSKNALPDGYTKDSLLKLSSVDVSENGDNSILAYWDGSGNIYVYSEDTILANSDSSYTFAKCSKLATIDLSSFDTSKVINMEYMFYYCRSLAAIDLNGFNTSEVTNMDGMFSYCSSLTTLNLSSFNTSKVTNMHSMFYYCRSLTTLNLSSFDTSKVANMGFMFYYCISLPTLDLRNFNTSKTINMNGMFEYSNKLTEIKVSSKWTTANADTTNMFDSCGTSSVTVVE